MRKVKPVIMPREGVKVYKSDNPLYFDVDMYGNIYGSLCITTLILSGKGNDLKAKKALKKRWSHAIRNPDEITWDITDPEFIDKTLSYFGLKRPAFFPIAFVQSQFNCLFLPYDKRKKDIYPIREDGIASITVRTGKIYPIDFNSKGEVKKDA